MAMNQMTKAVDIEEMAVLWNDKGMSTTEIGIEMGMSRSAVAGHINRNRSLFEVRQKAPVYARFKGIAPAERKPREPKPPNEAKPRNRRVNIQNIHKARQEACEREVEAFKDGTSKWLQIPLSDEERLATAKELMDLEAGDCRWILNNGGPHLFCAGATGGEIYCRHHALRAYRPLEKR
jgi:GcrA cell cycle regulator